MPKEGELHDTMITSLLKRGIDAEAKRVGAHEFVEIIIRQLWSLVDHAILSKLNPDYQCK
jgi:hypothetical protein